MNSFTRKDSLADAATQNLYKIRTASLIDTLKEATYNTNHRSALEELPSLFYFEKPEHLQTINAFIKRFLMGAHIDCMDTINRLNAQLNTIGLSIQEYDGESGTYDLFQYGNAGGDALLTGGYVVDDQAFARSGVHGQIKIVKTAVPGGFYHVDAEIYVTKKK